MVNVTSKLCSQESCSRRPTYNFTGLKKAVYCKEHAEEGMVNARRKERCAHDSCIGRPYYNIEGNKTAVYCKQHAKDGMVDIRNKRCLHGSCFRRPSLNVEGLQTPAYCKEHAGKDMKNVGTRRCSHGSCMSYAHYNIDGSKTPVWCMQHAENGMVHVRTRRSIDDRRRTGSARGKPINLSPTVRAQHKPCVSVGPVLHSDSPLEVVVDRRKRRKLEPDHCPFKKEGVVQGVEIDPTKRGRYASSFRASQSSLKESTARTTAEKTRQTIARTAPSSELKHQPGDCIKTEMELSVLF